MPRKKKKEPMADETPATKEVVSAAVPEPEPVTVEPEVVVAEEPPQPTLEELLNNPPNFPYPEMQRLLPWIEKLKEAAKR